MVQAIANQPPTDDSCLRAHFPEAAQIEFGAAIAKAFGYDFARGRLDKTHHPFCTKFAAGDVRITTRVRENDLADALFSTLHEGGHALYEQGVNPAYDGTPLASGTSSGVHETQSRLWENVVGRSHGFWDYFYPALQKTFPNLKKVPQETFYRAINKVARSLIRTDADEVTYNLHIMLRFDFELQLLEGRLAVKDLPEAWHERFNADLGIVPPDDRDGVLQDVHWFGGFVGARSRVTLWATCLGRSSLPRHSCGARYSAPDRAGRIQLLARVAARTIYRHGRKFTQATWSSARPARQ